jgi:hypothetical protein
VRAPVLFLFLLLPPRRFVRWETKTNRTEVVVGRPAGRAQLPEKRARPRPRRAFLLKMGVERVAPAVHQTDPKKLTKWAPNISRNTSKGQRI